VDFKRYAFQAGFRPFLLNDPRYNIAAGTYDASGKQLVNAPAVSLNLTGQKDFALHDGGDLFVRAQYAFTSKTYFDPTNVAIATRPAFSLVNASVGYSPPRSRWQVALWGKNLANMLYINGVGGGSFVTAPVGDPRTFGLRVNYAY
jgi:iron complex outermembrane receptor protein